MQRQNLAEGLATYMLPSIPLLTVFTGLEQTYLMTQLNAVRGGLRGTATSPYIAAAADRAYPKSSCGTVKRFLPLTTASYASNGPLLMVSCVQDPLVRLQSEVSGHPQLSLDPKSKSPQSCISGLSMSTGETPYTKPCRQA
jgi:hypothetical protein